MSKLKVCPFCGATTRGEYVKLKKLHGMYYVHCKNCSVQTGLFLNKDDAINLWNSRDQLTEIKYEIVAMQQDIIRTVNTEIYKRVDELWDSRAWYDNPSDPHLINGKTHNVSKQWQKQGKKRAEMH